MEKFTTDYQRGFGIELDDQGKWRRLRPLDGVDTSPPDVIEPIACALALFHVKNIGLRETQLPRPLRRALQKDGVEGPHVFRTLTLKPFAQDEEEKGAPRMSAGERPLHLVRGHFARYTKERPLFGKYDGLFWRPEHEAGNPAIAVVRKKYVVQPNTKKDRPGDG